MKLKNETVYDQISKLVEKSPDKIAIRQGAKTLSYSMLEKGSNQLANVLAKNVKENKNIVTILDQSIELVQATIGIMKAGCVFVPIDSGYPKSRIRMMIEKVEASWIVTTSHFLDKLQKLLGEKSQSIQIILMDEWSQVDQVDVKMELYYLRNYSDEAMTWERNSYSYISFTSGSTGIPKAILGRHKSLKHFIDWEIKEFQIDRNCVGSQLTTPSFDPFLRDIFVPLCVGGTICIPEDRNTLFSPVALRQWLSVNRITLVHIIPTLFRMLMDEVNDASSLPSLQYVFLAGELLRGRDVKKFLNLFEEQVQLVNFYGASETTMIKAFYRIQLDDGERLTIPVGKPMNGAQLLLLNSDMQQVPMGSVGEVYIRTPYISAGYYKDKLLNAKSFIKNPFNNNSDDILYKTGDKGRLLPSGNFEIIGRVDNQIKINGIRIEPEEIENRIISYPNIKQAVVIAREGGLGEQTLAAYFVSDEDVIGEKLRRYLLESLPGYMIPSSFIQMEQFPLTANGKINRKALPQPKQESSSEYVPPRNVAEKTLAKIWSKVLDREQVGVYDNFFELGGSSIKIIKLVSIARQHGIEFSIQDVFDKPTIALLIDHVFKNDQSIVKYQMEDFTLLHELIENNRINKQATPTKQNLGNVFITGATGWLGAHILDKFISSEKGMAYCLVRGKDLADSQNRLSDILTHYFGEKYLNCNRIVAVCGDAINKIVLEDPIDTVFHSAASVKHYGAYSYFYDLNVKATQNIILFAKEKSAKLIHISTPRVMGGDILKEGDDPTPIVYDETKLFVGQALGNVYARSKFEAEVAVLQAKLAGLPAIVVRVGNLTNRFNDLKFQKNYQENAFLTRLKTIVDLGRYPQELKNVELELSPVDYTAEAVIKLAQHFNHYYSIFHAYNPKTTQLISFINALESIGIKIAAVPHEEFSREMENATHIIGKELLYELFGGKHVISLNNEFTCSYLHEIGFQWCEINESYLRAYLQYFDHLGYWKSNN